MKKQPRNALIIIFAALTVISTLTLVGPTLNYLEFYRALERMDLSVSDLSWEYFPDQQKVDVRANFTVSNPTTFSGFVLRSIQIMGMAVLFAEGNAPLDLDGGISVWYRDPPINPNSDMTLPIMVHIEAVYAQNFMKNVEGHQSNIEWEFRSRLIVGTFLGDIPISFNPSFG